MKKNRISDRCIDREIAKGADNGGSGNLYVVSMCDYTTDLMAFRAGTSTAIAKLENFMPNNSDVEASYVRLSVQNDQQYVVALKKFQYLN